MVASANPGKVNEIKAILNDLPLEILSAKEFGIEIDVAETGDTYLANAKLKAQAYQAASGQIVLADDSGLEVDTLSGAPGLHSHRFAPGPDPTDADRRGYLLAQLAEHPQPWTAHFHCTAVLATMKNKVVHTEGRCTGVIIPKERGEGGFGYDPIFYIPDEAATLAEISAERKNQISHRAHAVRALVPALKELFKL
ncbi:RdgB/HAM1 family non-canonical purine NTP pyrophosphatase [bacterium]|nr:RdgB/HAM1 family non-canonical purine NTP pyrophosphatase [bacterium]